MINGMHDRNVTILRPAGLHPSRFLEELINEMDPAVLTTDEEENPYPAFDAAAHLDTILKDSTEESIAIIKELIVEIADRLKLKIHVYEYDLPKKEAPSRTASKWIAESNMLMSVDPTENQLAYICACMRQNHLMSTLLAHTEEDFLDQNHIFEYMNANAIPMIASTTKKQQRFFAGRLIKEQEETMSPLIEKALQYPL